VTHGRVGNGYSGPHPRTWHEFIQCADDRVIAHRDTVQRRARSDSGTGSDYRVAHNGTAFDDDIVEQYRTVDDRT
jgi:hypothetical protein